ncbi:hypothetical protein MVEN_02180900 [Mycena venus]|uniref:Uncharacterized protein n=1 Tax=Mycena venus TaxID=2733690 RepID=A0A8H7CGB9_9AGAR|nr:hypothetical protein MVEN_02180900 [Mycena venus]
MFKAFGLFLTILLDEGIPGPMGVDAATLAPTEAINFNSLTHPQLESHDGQMSTGQYVIEALDVQFNKNASSTPWVAIFSCNKDIPAGNTSDLIANAEKLGAHAILAYTQSATYQFCNLTDKTPPAAIPIYMTDNWYNEALVFSDQINGLFAPSQTKSYDVTVMNKIASNLTADFAAFRSNGSSLTQTYALLVHIPTIASNATAAAETAQGSSGLAPKSPSAAEG